MALKKRIASAVDRAFLAVNDLMIDVQLLSKSVTGFNFATGVTVNTTDNPVTKRLLIETKKVWVAESGMVAKTFAYFKSDGVVYEMYDKLVNGSERYSIISIEDTGYIVTLELSSV